MPLPELTWARFQEKCGLSTQDNNTYNEMYEACMVDYDFRSVNWSGTCYAGWYLGETSQPLPDYAACLDIMMGIRDSPGADLRCCLQTKDYNSSVREEVKALVPGTRIKFDGEIRKPLNTTKIRVVLSSLTVPSAIEEESEPNKFLNENNN